MSIQALFWVRTFYPWILLGCRHLKIRSFMQQNDNRLTRCIHAPLKYPGTFRCKGWQCYVPYTLKLHFFQPIKHPQKEYMAIVVKVSKIQCKISSPLGFFWISSIRLASTAKTAHAGDHPLWKCSPRDELTLAFRKTQRFVWLSIPAKSNPLGNQ